MITKPMLAGKCTDKFKIQYPVLATPKLDGIRCLKINGQALSRKFKPIPNRYIREMVELEFPDGVDGELMIDGAKFGEATGIIMSSKNSSPEDVDWVKFCVFDFLPNGVDNNTPYCDRMDSLRVLPNTPHMVKILPTMINTHLMLDAFEAQCLADGYEGIMIREPNGPYKCGRSTERERYLLKIKRFEDSEAEILGFVEKLHNQNEAKQDAFGHTKRSSNKDGMVPAGVLGAIQVRDIHTKQEFEIGSGFDDTMRATIWQNQDKFIGSIVKYKYQPYGVKDLPRFPIFLGIRHEDDI